VCIGERGMINDVWDIQGITSGGKGRYYLTV
jgi:hypothetical protein